MSVAGSPDGPSALIVGLSGLALRADEAAFLKACRPCGIIVFSRNYSNNHQLRELIGAARAAVGGDELLVLVDQEGGRVQRLRGPEWPDFPAAAAFGALYEADAEAGLAAARLANQWLASLLRGVGINTNCVPCLDLPVPGADGIIGDRAYGRCVETVTAVGGAVAHGMMASSVVPVMKHLPGHGRAEIDSHKGLPVVGAASDALRRQDFQPFHGNRGLPAAMSAHVTYRAFDETAPASVSKWVTEHVVRGEIGFDGLLMSDDISMHALSGSIGARARAVLEAGSDVVLHCNGDLAEMAAVARAVAPLGDGAQRRYARCLEVIACQPEAVDEAAACAAIERVRQSVGRGRGGSSTEMG